MTLFKVNRVLGELIRSRCGQSVVYYQLKNQNNGFKILVWGPICCLLSNVIIKFISFVGWPGIPVNKFQGAARSSDLVSTVFNCIFMND